MFAKIWRWLKKLWQQLLGKPPQPSPTGAETPGGEPNPRFSDAEYKNFFLQLLDIVAEGASRENIKGFFITKLIDEDELVAWLRRFGSKLLESPETHRELGRRMVQLGNVAGGELGDVAGEIGRELLGNTENKTSIVATSVKPIVDKKTADITNSVSVDVPADAEAVEWYKRSFDEYYAGNIQAALGCFQQAIDISPSDHYAWYGLGNALSNLRQYEQAIEAYQRAINISPSDHYAWNCFGAVLIELGQYERAIEAFQRAITINPHYDSAWTCLGNALKNLGQYEQAIKAHQRAIAISPNFDFAWNDFGNVLNSLGRYEQATEAFQKAISINPNFHQAWNGLGLVRKDLGQYQQAIEAFNRALKITHNQYWMPWANRGLAINKLHGYQAALQNWDEGLQFLQPETPDYQEGCAVLHQFKGDAHYFYAKQQPNPHPYWRESRNSYITALKTLSGSQTSILGEVLVAQVSPRFQLLYLEILQDLAKVCNALNYQDDFQLCLDIGDTMLENLLLETESQERKIQLAKKFATFSQLRVVLLAQSSQPKEALLLAEKRKNLGLRWLRESRYVGMREETPLQYPEIEQFLSPGMAAIYWHYSPAAITTFIIKLDPPNPPYQGGLREIDSSSQDGLREIDSSPQDGLREIDSSPQDGRREIDSSSQGGRREIDSSSQGGRREIDSSSQGGRREIDSSSQGGRREIDSSSQGGRREIDSSSQGGRREIDSSPQDGLREIDSSPQDGRREIDSSPQDGRREIDSSPQDGLREIDSSPQDGLREIDSSPQGGLNNSYSPLFKGGKGGSQIQIHSPENTPDNPAAVNKQLEKFEDWLKVWKEDYQANRKYGKGAKEEKETWREKMADRLDELGKILDVEGILNKIGDDITHLILIPHRDLHLLPLHYLLREKYFTITYLPSLKVGIDLQTDTPSTPKKLLSIESPSRLEYAETESQIIAQLYDNLTWIKSSKATKNTVIAAFSNSADIFHFTGHGEHNIHQPLESALELANKEMLTLQDIFQLNLKGYQLACLSACETGITSKQGIIDEYVGLVSGFLAKGVTHVISTLWQVGEIETALMMIKFHQLYKDNIPPALALQQTKTWLSTLTFDDLIQWYRQESAKLEEGSGCWESLQGAIIKAQQEAEIKGMNYCPYAHPYHWAGFIVSGNHQKQSYHVR